MRILIAAFFMLFGCTIFCADISKKEGEKQPLVKSKEIANSALFKAIKHKKLEDARKALEAKADPDALNKRGFPALYMACTKKRHEIAKLLLRDYKANPNQMFDYIEPDILKRTTSILGMAIQKGKWESVDLLIEFGGDLRYCDSAQKVAFENRSAEKAKEALKKNKTKTNK